MDVKKGPLGEQELELVRYATENAPVTVRQCVEGFGEPKGLARTTVLTMMERLRKKGFLRRKQGAQGFEYEPAFEQVDVDQGIVSQFVERMLGGSVSPLVAYLADAKSLRKEEVEQLKELVEELDRDHE